MTRVLVSFSVALAATAAVLLASCTTAGQVSTRAAPAGTPVADGWQPNEMLVPRGEDNYPLITLSEHRTGATPDGLKYTYYADGSGSVVLGPSYSDGRWSISCARDAMTDARNCHAYNSDARVFIDYGSSSSPRSVCIMGHDFPGRTGAIRIDQAPPINTDREGCVSGSIASAIASGSTVTTRRVKWPYDYHSDHTESLAGAASAMALLKFIRANIDRMQF